MNSLNKFSLRRITRWRRLAFSRNKEFEVNNSDSKFTKWLKIQLKSYLTSRYPYCCLLHREITEDFNPINNKQNFLSNFSNFTFIIQLEFHKRKLSMFTYEKRNLHNWKAIVPTSMQTLVVLVHILISYSNIKESKSQALMKTSVNFSKGSSILSLLLAES